MSFYQKWSKEEKLNLLKELLVEFNESDLKDKNTCEATYYSIKDTMTEAKRREENPNQIYGIPTGLKKIDDCLGGMVNQELIVVGGQTGHGKTLLVQNIILNNALQGKKIMFFTLEMSPVETTLRFRHMAKRYGITDEVLEQLPINYIDTKGFNSVETVSQVVAVAQEMSGVDLLVIDHLHFFARSVDNATDEISVLTKKIKEMARERNIPVILVSHLRKLNNQMAMPTLDDFKDSSAIAQDADTVLSLWRDMRDGQNHRIMRIQILKNRRRGVIDEDSYTIGDYHTLEEMTWTDKNN